MKNASFRYLAIIFSLVILFSCKKDESFDCSGAWAFSLTDEATAVGTAASIYAEDPSTANCNAYKDAYRDYIDALKPYGDCGSLTGQDRAAWQQSLDEAQANLDSLC